MRVVDRDGRLAALLQKHRPSWTDVLQRQLQQRISLLSAQLGSLLPPRVVLYGGVAGFFVAVLIFLLVVPILERKLLPLYGIDELQRPSGRMPRLWQQAPAASGSQESGRRRAVCFSEQQHWAGFDSDFVIANDTDGICPHFPYREGDAGGLLIVK